MRALFTAAAELPSRSISPRWVAEDVPVSCGSDPSEFFSGQKSEVFRVQMVSVGEGRNGEGAARLLGRRKHIGREDIVKNPIGVV
jgi:hypothetical protein